LSLAFTVNDADNHYYEDEESFTRHLPDEWAARSVQWVSVGDQRRMVVAGSLLNFVPNDTFDPVAKPGALDDWFRGKNPSGKTMMELYNDMQPCPPSFRRPNERLLLMDEQQIEKTVMFPTMACGVEIALKDDIPALAVTLQAFNRWLDEDWGLNNHDRIFSAPLINLADIDWAVRELEWALTRDVRVIYMSPNPVPSLEGWISLGDPSFNIFWERVEAAGVTVAFHQASTIYQKHADYWVERVGAGGLAFGSSPMRGYMHDRAVDGAIGDTIAALVCHGVFARFPKLRVLSIENGSEWVDLCIRRLRKAYGQMPKAFHEDPLETFKRHLWIAPYQEDDFPSLREIIGTENMLFGSDYPHPEGIAVPTDFVKDFHGFTQQEVQAIMRENLIPLLSRQPA
jgi:predicted TIM-barrel fold metal-dependent hydrolase